MKKFLLLLAVAIITSCSSDDTQSLTNDNSSIYGKWKIVEYLEDGVDLEPCELLSTHEYFQNSNLQEVYFYGNNCQNTDTDNINFSISGNVLTHTEVGGGLNPAKDYVVKYHIQSLTETELIIQGFYVNEGVDGIEPTEIPENERFVEKWQRIQ